jgi:hypothetical protein
MDTAHTNWKHDADVQRAYRARASTKVIPGLAALRLAAGQDDHKHLEPVSLVPGLPGTYNIDESRRILYQPKQRRAEDTEEAVGASQEEDVWVEKLKVTI